MGKQNARVSITAIILKIYWGWVDSFGLILKTKSSIDNLKLLLFHLKEEKQSDTATKKTSEYFLNIFWIFPYKEALVDIVEEDKVAEHWDEAEESKTSDNVDYNIFQIKLSFTSC